MGRCLPKTSEVSQNRLQAMLKQQGFEWMAKTTKLEPTRGKPLGIYRILSDNDNCEMKLSIDTSMDHLEPEPLSGMIYEKVILGIFVFFQFLIMRRIQRCRVHGNREAHFENDYFLCSIYLRLSSVPISLYKGY